MRDDLCRYCVESERSHCCHCDDHQVIQYCLAMLAVFAEITAGFYVFE